MAERYRLVFETFSKKVAYMGSAGSGQMAKLINNALLMMNQKNNAPPLLTGWILVIEERVCYAVSNAL